ncbi:MAG: S16 family serine protease [Actinomycetes bacterium]
MINLHPTRKLRDWRWVAAGIVVVLALGAITAGVVTRGGGNTVVVNALWYGKAADGSVHGGVTPVEITAVADDANTPMSVDLTGVEAAGAGPMWTAATASAAAQAVLDSGVDPRAGELTFTLKEAIDGPSAGALMTVGSLAAIAGTSLSASMTMTGTVLPDGSVGPVGGVPEKIRGAAAAGFTRVLVPAGQAPALDPATGTLMDLAQVGRAVGVEVTTVSSVAQAYRIMTGQAPTAPTAAATPIDATVLDLLADRSRELNATASQGLRTLPKTGTTVAKGVTAKAESLRIEALIGAANAALQSNDPVLAFTASAEAAQDVQQWQASWRLETASASVPLSALTEQTRRDVDRAKEQVVSSLHTTAELPLSKVEQLPALSDALAWGEFALASMNVAQKRLESVRTTADLQGIVRFVETARFEAETYMATCAQAVPLVGSRPLTDVQGTVDLLNSYADLLDFSADSNRAYAESIGRGGSDLGYLEQLINESASLTDSVAEQFPELTGPTARVALRTAAALQDFVDTTYLVNDLTSPGYTSANVPPNLAPVKDPETLRSQAGVADGIANTQAQTLSSMGLDPSYATWTNQWGSSLSLDHLPKASDEQRLHGLETQWFAVLQTRLLVGLNALAG